MLSNVINFMMELTNKMEKTAASNTGPCSGNSSIASCKAGVTNYSKDELNSLMEMILLERLPISTDDWDLIVDDHAKM